MNTALEFLKSQINKDAKKSPSPLMRWLNPTIISVARGSIELEFIIREEMTNPIGVLHGGITSAIIDDTIGVAIFSLGETHFYMTINNSIDYFSSVSLNEKIYAKSELIKKGKQLINAKCEIWNADKDKLLAIGYSNLIKTARNQ